ncbi:oligosaccharyltransferase alpha subunit [Coprinopsis cinerea okayama7|uniref:Dolichyl-diphosphooligosaccharide--protein glycosyltransferase subunit 1 n=1 Tax=Coprinopsis cinerea (strain Okayama-7 / 130 / ATCC MYA-4618 / FGSC 9003) TaxID=240176 RepID=A8NXG5_COPC7|nr:oligosaccharyltransferase alpha subunit [Coprinopsis cinerea okayama7\|eukprot:XP_001837161.1 oligosaccharyltransferase alpha subunit [Coprinopsis cinerea okayama7\
MPFQWASVPLLLLLWSTSAVLAGPAFENTAIVRTVELGGSVVHVTTTYAVRALENNVKTYTVALGAGDRAKTSWLEAKIKGQDKPLDIKERVEKGYSLIDVTLPKALSTNKTLNLVFETVQTHATYPWPATAAQGEEQKLKYATELFVLSPYSSVVQRSKIRAMVPRIVSFTEPVGIEPFTSDSVATKSGATIVYGPYNNIPASTNVNFIQEYQQTVVVHYHHEQPVIEILDLKRAVEVSHWGANINTQDEITLHNAGPKLKGHFSRFEHQKQSYQKKPAPHMLPALQLSLPAGIRDAYYYDQIGNVSTSKLRVAPLAPKGSQRVQHSVLELRPRYPLLGGWNYSFTLGWDAPLESSVSYDKKTGVYTLEVPILTPVPGSVVNHEELKIILPEGATDVQFATPFPPESVSTGTHVTYLDTVGRPSITLEYRDLTVKHAREIYVTYKVPFFSHIRKAISVAGVFFTLFSAAILLPRISLSISRKQKVQ